MRPERLEILRTLANAREKTVSEFVSDLIERGRMHGELSRQVDAMQARIEELEAQLDAKPK